MKDGTPGVRYDPFEAAEDAHGAANPESHRWADQHTAERFAIAFLRFEDCETRDGTTVETIVGRLKDGSYSREWLFPPDKPDSRGWRAQQLEFIDEIRSELKPGDILVQELGAERPSTTNTDRKVRPFRGTHFPTVAEQGVASDATTEYALQAEKDERDESVSEADAVRMLNEPLGESEGVVA